MPHIRIIAAAAAAVALAFVMSPAQARSCDDGNESCAEVARRTSPMKLDQFMKTWKPVAASKRAKKSKAAAKKAPAKEIAKPATEEVAEPAAQEAAAVSDSVSTVAASPQKTIETDGVAVTSFDEVNEIDGAADQVQVVAFNEINEIDLAAPLPPAASPETTGQAAVSPEVSTDQTPADTSWIGKLLLAFAGTIAVAGATRLLLA